MSNMCETVPHISFKKVVKMGSVFTRLVLIEIFNKIEEIVNLFLRIRQHREIEVSSGNRITMRTGEVTRLTEK